MEDMAGQHARWRRQFWREYHQNYERHGVTRTQWKATWDIWLTETVKNEPYRILMQTIARSVSEQIDKLIRCGTRGGKERTRNET